MMYSFYVALLRDKDAYTAYIPSLHLDIPVSHLASLEATVQEHLAPLVRQNKISLALARQDAIMSVVNQTKKRFRFAGRSIDDFIDTIKINMEV